MSIRVPPLLFRVLVASRVHTGMGCGEEGGKEGVTFPPNWRPGGQCL